MDYILINDYAEKEKKADKESNDMPPEKPKLSEIEYAIELLECWSHFDNSGSQIRQLLSLISKSNRKYAIFSKNFKNFVILQGKDLRSI